MSFVYSIEEDFYQLSNLLDFINFAPSDLIQNIFEDGAKVEYIASTQPKIEQIATVKLVEESVPVLDFPIQKDVRVEEQTETVESLLGKFNEGKSPFDNNSTKMEKFLSVFVNISISETDLDMITSSFFAIISNNNVKIPFDTSLKFNSYSSSFIQYFPRVLNSLYEQFLKVAQKNTASYIIAFRLDSLISLFADFLSNVIKDPISMKQLIYQRILSDFIFR